MRARWETGETLAWVLRHAPDVPVSAAFACAAGERETAPAVMARTAPAVAILLARTGRSLPIRGRPPVRASAKCWTASPAELRPQCMCL
jgi:hypothetical protein